MKALLSKGKTKLKSVYRKSVSPNPPATKVDANDEPSENHGQVSMAPERPLGCHENVVQHETPDVGNGGSVEGPVDLLETSRPSVALHEADLRASRSEYSATSTQASVASVVSPSANATVSSETATLESSDADSHDAYWYLAMKRLGDSERRILEELDLTFDGDTSGLRASAPEMQAAQPSKPGLNDEKASKLGSLVSERINRLDDKAWRFRFRGRDIILRDLASKVVTWLNKFKEVGDLAIQIDPVHAALPWAAIRFLLQAATAEQELAGHMLIGSEKVSYLLTRCQIYRKLYLSETEDLRCESAVLLRRTLLDLYTAILRFLVYLMKLATGSSVRRGLHASFNPNGLSERLSQLETLESKIETEATNCERQSRALSDAVWNRQMDAMQRILSKHVLLSEAERAKHFEECELEERCLILQWISDIQYEADLYNARMGRTEGTGQWLLEDTVYRDWRGTSASICLWLHGIPGAGKTKLSTKVVDDLFSLISGQASNEGLAFFFFDRNREKHKDPVWVLRTLLRQLAASLSNTTIVKCIRDKYIEAKAKGFASSITQEQCSDLLLELANIFPQTTFVLDGLDECDKDTRHLLMDALDTAMRKAGHPVKVFIASREHDDIALRYSSGDHLKVTALRNQRDIEKFVSDRMLSSRYCRTRMAETVRQQVLTTFRVKSQGMFQWAALHIQELLKLERDSDVCKYLIELPVGLKAAYDKIYDEIKTQRGGKSDIAITAMKMLICAPAPLTPSELAIAACQVPDQDFNENIDIGPGYLLEACHDLIEVYHGGPTYPRYVIAEEAQLLRRVVERNPAIGRPWRNFDGPVRHARTSATSSVASETTSSRNSLLSLRSNQSEQCRSDAETDAQASWQVRDIVYCRFSHLSVVEYLHSKWDVAELHAFAARLCFRTLLRFAIPGTFEEQQQVPQPQMQPFFEYWPPSKAYRHIEEIIRWRFAELATAVDLFKFNLYSASHEPPIVTRRQDLDVLFGQAPIHWLLYCIRGWYFHLRAATRSPSIATEIRDNLNSLLGTFHGHPTYGSCFFRAWVMLCNLFDHEGCRKARKLLGFQRFYPAFWCAAVGDLESLVTWMDGGILNADFACDGWSGSTRLGMELSEPDRMPDVYVDTFSLIRTAIRNSNESICSELLSRGAGRRFNVRREATIEIAIRSKQSSVVQQYIKSGIDINQEYSTGTLLHSAIYAGTLEMVQLLVDGGADLNLRMPVFYIPWQLTPLELACFGAFTEQIAIYLVGRVSNIALDSPLAVPFAALTNKIELLSVLASSGAKIDACVPGFKFEEPLPFQVGETPLLSFVRCALDRSYPFPMYSTHDKKDGLRTLLEHGANPNVVDADGRTPLQMALYEMDNDLIIPLVLYGADLTTKENDGTTVLQRACRQGDVNLIRLLISRGADVNEVSGVFRTALRAAYIEATPPLTISKYAGLRNKFSKVANRDYGSRSSIDDGQSERVDVESSPTAMVDKCSDDHSDQGKSEVYSSNADAPVSTQSLVSDYSEGSVDSESTASDAHLSSVENLQRPRRRLITIDFCKQLEAGIVPAGLPYDDDPSAVFCVLLEHGAVFDREHYSASSDISCQELDLMELLFNAYSEQLRRWPSERGIENRFLLRSSRPWGSITRIFVGWENGYIIIKYRLAVDTDNFWDMC